MAKVLTLKGAVIVFYTGQLAAMVLLLFREGNSSGWGDVYAALAVGALCIAVGAGAAVAALFVLRLAREGLPWLIGGLVARGLSVAVILCVSAQLAAFVLFMSSDLLFGSESRWGDVFFDVGLGVYVSAGVAGAVAIVLFVPRLIRSVARVGVLPLIGSLFGIGPNPDALDDAIDDALGFGEADDEDGGRVIADHADPTHGARLVVVGKLSTNAGGDTSDPPPDAPSREAQPSSGS
jgi:hypothetical protein